MSDQEKINNVRAQPTDDDSSRERDKKCSYIYAMQDESLVQFFGGTVLTTLADYLYAKI